MHLIYGSPSRGLTLTEVLLSTAAIAALGATILLPLAGPGGHQSELATCLSNMRHLMTATHMYLLDHDDRFLFVLQAPQVRTTCSWAYGGKTPDYFWWNQGPFYHRFKDRPLNPYILAGESGGDVVDAWGTVIQRAEVPQLCCPSNQGSYQRSLGSPQGDPPKPTAYDDIGTSYHFNLASFARGGFAGIDVRRYGMSLTAFRNWLWYKDGWTLMARDLLHDAFARFPQKYVLYFEDPVDYAINMQVQLKGDHGELGVHSMAFLDGHATCSYADTRYYCGPEWYAMNPQWVREPNEPPANQNSGKFPAARFYYYTNWVARTCPPH